jgi:hypothetical protein
VPDRLDDIMLKEPKHTIGLNLGDRAVLFPTPADAIARGAVCHAMANHDVACAEEAKAHDAQATPLVECQ